MSPITIERIETRLVDLPTIRPHKLSVATMHGQTMMLVNLTCSDGVTGIGEGTTIAGMAYGPESPEAMKLAIDAYLAPAIIGHDATRIQTLMAFLGKLATCETEQTRNENRLRDFAFFVGGRLKGLARCIGEAVQVQAIIPIGTAD